MQHTFLLFIIWCRQQETPPRFVLSGRLKLCDAKLGHLLLVGVFPSDEAQRQDGRGHNSILRVFLGNGQRGGIPPPFFSQTGVQAKQAHRRCSHVPQLARTSILKRWQGARSPCRRRTRTFFCSFLWTLGLTAPRRRRGFMRSPAVFTCVLWGYMPPHLYFICCVLPLSSSLLCDHLFTLP